MPPPPPNPLRRYNADKQYTMDKYGDVLQSRVYRGTGEEVIVLSLLPNIVSNKMKC